MDPSQPAPLSPSKDLPRLTRLAASNFEGTGVRNDANSQIASGSFDSKGTSASCLTKAEIDVISSSRLRISGLQRLQLSSKGRNPARAQ